MAVASGLFCLTLIQAQPEPYPFNFTQITKDQGLPHNYCHTALRDRRGFLWFGTQDGLARYDGVRMKVFPARADSTGLSAPTVLDLDEDAGGLLWIATRGGGLNRFDPETETFACYRKDPRDAATAPGNDLTNLLIDADGSIWVGGLSCGLGRLDPVTGRFQNFALAQNLTTAEDRFRRNSVLDIAADLEAPHALWLAANNGIFRLDKRTGHLRHFPAQTPCHDVLADQPGVVWVATDGGGIARVEKKSGRWQFFPPLPDAWATSNLSANLIADISRKSDREFWVASLDLGFGIFDVQTREYRFFSTQSKLLAGQINQSVNGLYRDPAGLLWVFNYKNGVSLLDPASNVFDYTPLPGVGCQNPMVNEPQDFAWNEPRQELYVVTAGCQGFYVFQREFRQAPVGRSPYRLKYAVPPPKGGPAYFQRVLIDRWRRVWVGAQPEASGVGLYEYLPAQRRLQPFRMAGPAAAALLRYPVNDLAEDYLGNLWVATTRGGLFRIDFKRNAVDWFRQGGDFDGSRMQIADIVCLAAPAEVPQPLAPGSLHHEEQVWFSTKEAGVFCFYPVMNKFVRYGHQPGADTGLADDYVTAIEHDRHNSVWVATASQGLQVIPLGAPAQARFPHFTVRDGLAFNTVHRLALAPDGRLWAATEKGISVFYPETKRFEGYDEDDGLADTYLSRKGFRWCTNGEIFVGQAKGFYSFRPDSIFRNTRPPVLAFTGFDLFGRPYPTGKDLNFRPEVRLKHDQNFFTIHFAALSLSQAKRNRYFYQLEQVDPGWLALGNRAEVSYTQVPPGKYRFRVRAQNSSGIESVQELAMTVVIAPAFYQTWWFRIAILAVLAAGFLAYFRARLDRIIRQETAKNELNRLRAVKAELENKALRSQMNPHFIFNALNTIEALIVEEKPDAASALLQKFSKLVRLVLENSQLPTVSLAQELEALDLYIQLEQIRLNNRFQYQIEVYPGIELHGSLVPPMILQPFVENAILHGLRHLRDREGRLLVRLEQVASRGPAAGRLLRCQIEDNGIGRAHSAEINARSRISGKKQSLGTQLTTERVALLNAPGQHHYSVEITDIATENRCGTIVTVLLPFDIDR